MKRILLSALLVLAFAATSYALPVRTAEYGAVTPLNYSPAQNQCLLYYCNFCSFWVYYWSFGPGPGQFGTCWDLADCCDTGCESCRVVTTSIFGFRRMSVYGFADFAVYCADNHCCPSGAALATAVGVPVNSLWTIVDWGGLDLDQLCPPGQCTFITMGTHTHPNDNAPYSDGDNLNWDNGCGTTWTCVPHSFVYVGYDTLGAPIDYCQLTGYPSFMFFPDARSYCQTQFGIGFYHNWLAYQYVDCWEPSASEQNSWSEIKALYK
jgi:hypothetical protein